MLKCQKNILAEVKVDWVALLKLWQSDYQTFCVSEKKCILWRLDIAKMANLDNILALVSVSKCCPIAANNWNGWQLLSQML